MLKKGNQDSNSVVMSKVVIVHHNLGPYHIARLKCLKEYIQNLVIIELASKVDMRNWKRSDASGLEVITLVNENLDGVPVSELTKKLIDSLENIQPQCLIVAGYAHPALRAAAFWARKSVDCATILLSESQTIDRSRNYIKEKLKSYWIRKLYSNAFASGARAASYLETLSYPGHRIWRGYSVVDNSHFGKYFGNDSLISRSDIEDLPDKYFLYVGRFSPEKNLIRLIKAYKSYVDQAGPESWSLVLLGGGPQEMELRKLCEKLGIEKKVIWPGFKQIDELPIYYALASVFLLPSTLEPWGLVVNEAMAAGLPVLVSNNCGCVMDLVDQGVNGSIINPYDENDITAKLYRYSSVLHESKLAKMGQASQKIINNYSTTTWSIALADCIAEARSKF